MEPSYLRTFFWIAILGSKTTVLVAYQRGRKEKKSQALIVHRRVFCPAIFCLRPQGTH
jgi:hypothetical protein